MTHGGMNHVFHLGERMFNNNSFSDYIIYLKKSGKVIHCHLSLLAHASSYFEAIFSVKHGTDIQEETCIESEEDDEYLFYYLIKSVYYMRIVEEIPKNRYFELMILAQKYGFNDIANVCEKYLMNNIDAENCFHMFMMNQFPILRKHAIEFLTSNSSVLDSILNKEENLRALDFEDYSELLKIAGENGLSLEYGAELINKWIDIGVEDRNQFSCGLFQLFSSSLKVYEGKMNVLEPCLQKWCKEENLHIVRMLYKASVDGFSSNTFHSKCDNQGPTLTVITTTNGRRFGGFTSQSWKSNSLYICDPNAWLFSIDNETKLQIDDPKSAIHGHYECGPIFGMGCDLCKYTLYFIIEIIQINVVCTQLFVTNQMYI
jgi:hypothetical protein